MIRVYLFALLMWGSCLYAIVRGGWSERVVAISFLIGTGLTEFAITPGQFRFHQVELRVAFIDTVVFAALFAVALFSRKYWPLWMTAMQGVAILAHFAPLLPTVVPLAYANAISLWSWPMMALLAVATYHHRRPIWPGARPLPG